MNSLKRKAESGSKKKEGNEKTVDETAKSITEIAKETAEAVLSAQTDYTFDEASGLYYDRNSGYYYDPVRRKSKNFRQNKM